MRILKWATAALIALYALKSTLPAGSTLAYKLGWLHVASDMKPYEALMAATTWPMLVGWSVSIGLYLFAALSLVTRNGRAFLAYACALLVDLMFFLAMKQDGVYDRTFTTEERMIDWVLLSLLLVVAAVVWVIERREQRALPV